MPTNSSLQGSPVIIVQQSHSATCAQHDTYSSSTVAIISSLSSHVTSLPVNNESVASSVEQEIGVVTTGKD